MEWNGLMGLIYGLLSGLFEFLPASPAVHQRLYLKITGLDAPGYGMSLAVHIGALAAVFLSCYTAISKINRERKLARAPRRRMRQPDAVSLMLWKLLRVAGIPLVLSCIMAPFMAQWMDGFWMAVLFAVVNGIIVLMPHYMAHANKDARSLSPLDALLIGMGGMIGAFPGCSRIAGLNAVGSIRGADRQFALDFTLLLSIPALVTLCIMDVIMLIAGGGALAGALFFSGVLACIGAFAVSFAGIRLMRFLAVKTGYESLAYYNIGLAMFTLVLYLIG